MKILGKNFALFLFIFILFFVVSGCDNSPQPVIKEVRVITGIRSEVIITATPEPLPTSFTATPQKTGKVTVDNTILRAGPENSYQYIETLYKGELLSIFAKNQDGTWLFVLTPIGNRGWIPINYIQSLDIFDDIEISEFIINTPTISPTSTVTYTKTITRTSTPTRTATTKSSATKQVASLKSSTPVSDQNHVNFLVEQYEEYVRVFERLNKSQASGEDVRVAYLASLEIIETLNNKNVPSHLEQLKSDLIEGISRQSTGFGCYSNSSLCNGDLEATKLLLEGKVLLDNFIDEVNTTYSP